ncbi:hypothetical protein BU16DRAFT_565267 [Lophium mytilinum]|uniref:Uncharacterized protein n=1 Tax=Lophium mytilinum TaxID=390894 RepID=A0A6A6QJD5_9PEZI|nr:hypothetical protein BU16DRAFT_565267 [Lophium mytilinum]
MPFPVPLPNPLPSPHYPPNDTIPRQPPLQPSIAAQPRSSTTPSAPRPPKPASKTVKPLLKGTLARLMQQLAKRGVEKAHNYVGPSDGDDPAISVTIDTAPALGHMQRKDVGTVTEVGGAAIGDGVEREC